jgi:ABC-type branched-subunit amino acid transport system permease subunit
VSAAWQFYIATLIVYAFVYIIAAAGLNLQFGLTGVYNFAFIIFEAAGAYCTAVLSLGSPSAFGGFQSYILGLHLPFPLPLFASAVVAGALGVGLGALTVRRLRADYLAIVMLVISLIATGLVTDYQGLFNGAAGLALIPQPFASLTSSSIAYDWVFALVAGVICVLVLLGARLMIASPLGRTLRAVRENENAAAALGKNVTALRLVLAEGSRFLPQFGPPTLVPSLEWIAIGVILLAFLWFWPRGIVPEPRRIFPAGPASRPRVPQIARGVLVRDVNGGKGPAG